MLSWKAKTFQACATLLPPALYVFLLQSSDHVSVAWTAVFGLAYVWILSVVVIPGYFNVLNTLPDPPNDSFLFGHINALFGDKNGHGKSFLRWATEVPNNGLIHFAGIAHAKHRVLITTPQGVQDAMVTHAYDYEKDARAHRFLSRILGRGLIVVEGKEHKMQRKAVAPAFHGKHIRELVPTFWKKAVDFANAVSSEMSGERDPESGFKTGEIEINAIAQRVTLDIIGLAGLGTDFNTLENSGDELAQQYEAVLNPKRSNIATLFAVNMLCPPWLLRVLPWKPQKVVNAASINLRRICRRLVREKKLRMAKQDNQQIDILSILLRQETFDDDFYVNQLLTFLAAGHETTSSALTWALWLLSTHTAVQAKLRDEVLKFIPRSDSPNIDASLLDQMEYLTAVCNEVLRLYPTVPNTGREAIRDTWIGNQKIPKGAMIVVSPWMMNRLPSIWGADAGDFKPERWFGKHQPANQSSYNFLTFIHGPHSCIGQGFSRAELKCLLAAVIRRFDVAMAHPDQEVVATGAISIKPKGGMDLHLSELATS